ncbi:integrin alpha-8-like [Anticarsia gemmatalis]|uniref:integrin alpha-8-like n=1 Tax=Anticarsia gemmatalis TaxID=129554 RepID=UPI003F768E3A
MSAILTLTSLMTLFWRSEAVFLHEPSMVSILPDERINGTDFGFSLGFQNGKDNLVVGAPSVDLKGKVYSCDMNNASVANEISCQDNYINFDKYASKNTSPVAQHFYTGSSIAATSSKFLTCAPLWTSDIGSSPLDTIGTCFIFKNEKQQPKRYKGIYESFKSDEKRGTAKLTDALYKSIAGGTGFTTLADEEHDLFIIAKTTLDGDFVHTSVKQPVKRVKSAVLSGGITFTVGKYFNLGHGMAAGKFFDPKETVYAFSMRNSQMGGIIEFLKYSAEKNLLSIMNPNVDDHEYTIESEGIGTMFGAALVAADLNMDGMDELLVGAPAQSERNCVECGALHVYLGGNMKDIGKRHFLEIQGNKEMGRFGTAIISKDIDGDHIPEIVVSAPYEDNGRGAVYILSGYEIQTKLMKYAKDEVLGRLKLSDLKNKQRIQKENFRTFGYSLQFVQDADDNGCSELVAGSPGSGKAVLFKCIQNIKVSLSSSVLGDQPVREQDSNFTVKVCADVEYPRKPVNITANLTIKNSISGGGTDIKKPDFLLDISCNYCLEKQQFCDNIIVDLTDTEPRDFVFTSQAVLHTDHILNSTTFDQSWVVANRYSSLNKTLEVPRHCKGDDCIPNLSMKVLWSRDKNTRYVIGSSDSETVTLHVRNDGNHSYEACVRVFVTGAPVSRLDCPAIDGGYRCDLPRPLRRDAEHSINLVLNMTELTNEYDKLVVKAMLHERCGKEDNVNDTIEIKYFIPTDDIYVYGISHSRNVTDQQMMDKKFSLFDSHEYIITNNGSINWKNVQVKIYMRKEPYTDKLKVLMDKANCVEYDNNDTFTQICSLNLPPFSVVKFSVTTEIFKSYIQEKFINKAFEITSSMGIYLLPTIDIKTESISSMITYQKELTIANNKWLIGWIAAGLALLILFIIIIVLYKYGFFKRKQKQRLHVLRESIKQRNSRRNTHVSSVADGQGLQIDVDDDPFDEIPISKDNDLQFVETSAQVHQDNNL